MAAVHQTDTILYEVRQAALQLSQTPPIGVYDSQDELAQLMGSLAPLAGMMVNDAYDWQSQRLTFTATGDAVRTAWDMPADFARFVDETGWSSSFLGPVTPLNAQDWALGKAWSTTYFTQMACRIRNDQLQFMSAPALGQVITFEYVNRNWVKDADDPLTLKAKTDKNGDIPVFDWLLMVLALKVKWLETKRMDNTGAMADFNDRLRQLNGNEILGARLSLNGRRAPMRYLDGCNVPPTGFGL